MKKLLISILSFVLIAFASIGGGLLLSGCGSSYSESTGGGIGDNENHENLGDDDEIEIPSDDEDNGGSDNNENDDVTLSSTFNINLTVYTMNSSGNYVTGLDQRQEGYTAGGSTTFGNSGGAGIWVSRSNGSTSERKYTQSGTTSVSWRQGSVANATANISVTLPKSGYPYTGQKNEMYILDHIQCSRCGRVTSTSHSCYIGTPAGIWGNYTTTYSVYFARKSYNINVNILSPDGAEDNKSGTVDLKYSWNGSTSNNVTDQPSSSRIYADTSLIISDIKPASGYYVRNVSCSKGSLGNSNGTYTYKVVDSSYSWPNPGSGFYDTVVVQMGRYTQQNINILSPSGSEDGQSGTMDVYYSFNNTRYDNQTNEPITGTSVKDNSYIEISDIRPATGMEVASVKVGNTSVSASNGVYRIDCNATQTIVIQMQWIKYNININILSPSGSEDYKSGTIDIYYSHTGDTYDDQTNEPITGNSIPYGSTVRISDIKPASGMRLSAVDDGSSNISNSNGTYSITVTKSLVIYVRMAWKEYYVDVNIMSPSGVQDKVSGTVDLTYSSPDQTVNDANNEPTLSLLAHGGTLKISDIKPATGYRVSSVSISENRGKLEDNGDGTYTFTASTDWTHQTKWYNTIVIQMAWKEYNVNINILSPTGAEDNKSGTVDLSYSSPSQTHNDVNNEPSPSRLTHGATLTISDIKPATGYRLSSVSINENRGSLVNNGDGTYTFTASADWTHQTNWYNTIVIQMAYQSYKLRIYAMKGIDDIRQPATTWYTDRVGRYKEVDVNYMTAYTTTVTVLSGYSFNKWTNTNNSNAAALSNSTSYKFTMPASNLTLYAFAKGNSYTISYSSNGKIVGTKLVTYGSSYGELLNISNTREGFTFGGWYLNNTFVTPITASTTVRTAGNHTLYAKWTAKNQAQYDEELGKWYVEMGKYPQTSIIDSDLRNWTEYNGSNYSNIMYDKATKMSTFTVKTVGVWEILAIQIPAPLTSSADGTYTLTFDYVVPNYNGLVSSDYSDTNEFQGSDGLAVQIINSTGPANTHCTDRDYLTYRLPTKASSGTVTATFTNISSTNTIWVVINGGYVADNQTVTFSLGNFRLSTTSRELPESGNRYTIPMVQNDGTVEMVSHPSYILSDGNEYIRYNGNATWYKVEPVKYYLAGDYFSGYGTEDSSVTAVTDKVIIASVWNDEYVGLGEGYHISQTTIWTNDGVFVQDSGLVDIKGDGYSENSYTTWQAREVVNFGSTSSGIQIENYNFQDGISSTKDMDEVFGEGNYEAEFSDLVADILGNALMYWTRDVGSELNNAECITRYGTVIQAKMQNLLGARITTNVKTFACV